MIQRIGKYRILGQIGRGGMGTVYRAHDPILDRTVALKVISSEADLTDELRARFFREAQACAKLSHPNIITVHDLGEEEGHLFIVMEYLEGEELKQVIAQRRPLTLEAKLQIMVQICAGLEYAHQKGVIHRDIKPGNIFVLRSGTAKILDFGIARIASEATGLTRTGLIMGTLRYMSPEQARGQVDHRSDIFSAGAVFYELLTGRVPFAGDDAIQILEQLRSHDPVPIVELDPALPAALGAAIHRALRKDPADRFPGFGELRIELDRVRRQLEEHSGALRSRLRERVDEVGQLRQTWAERAGAPPPADPGPGLDEPASLTAIEARYRELSAEADQLVHMVRRAEAFEPELRSALARLEQGDAEGAAQMLLPIVQGLPEHLRAAEALARAKGRVEEQRRERERVQALLAEAEADFEGGAYARCLERLGPLSGLAGADLGERVEGLREAAAAALAAEEAARREAARQAAERAARARTLAGDLRGEAERAGAPALASPLWSVAEQKLADAESALDRQAFTAASKRLEEAVEVYRRAAEVARREAARRSRERAERARGQMETARRRAAEASAQELAGEIWSGAEATAADAERELRAEAHEPAEQRFAEASALFERAAEAARQESGRRARERARRAEGEVVAAHASADEAGAPALAAGEWARAETARAEGQTHLDGDRAEEAADALDRAAGLYRRAAEAARREAVRQLQERADRARAESDELRERARKSRADALAPETWGHAESRRGEALAELESQRWTSAARGFDEAAALYRRAAEDAQREAEREARRRAEERAARARGGAAAARERAEAAEAIALAADLWRAAEARRAAGEAALGQDALEPGGRQLEEARELFERAAEAAQEEGVRRARARAEVARGHAESARAEAEQAGAPGLDPQGWSGAEAMRAAAQAALGQGQYVAAAEAMDEVAARFRQGAESARAAAVERAREQARALRVRAAEARSIAAGADVQGLAPDLWTSAEGKIAAGDAALTRQLSTQAMRLFEEALDLYQRSAEAAREEAMQAARDRAERARQRAQSAREHARGLGADALAPEAWQAAESRLDAGQTFAARGEHDSAARELDEAVGLYEAAGDGARREDLRRTREDVERRQVEARRARRRAAEAEAPRLAAETWNAAEARLADAAVAAGQGALRDGLACLDEALRLYARAEVDAQQEAERRREAARIAAAEAQEACRRARDAAEEASADQPANTAWSAAVDDQGRAEAALARGEIEAAREHFARAQSAFAQAGHQAESGRRVGAARARAAAGEIAEAVGALEGLLADEPSHGEALALLQELRDQMRTSSTPPAPERTVFLKGQPATDPDATTWAAPTEPPDSDRTIYAAGPSADDATRVIQAPAVPGAGPARAARHEPQRRRLSAAGWRAAAAAAGLALAIAGAGTWYALSPPGVPEVPAPRLPVTQPQPEAPPAPISSAPAPAAPAPDVAADAAVTSEARQRAATARAEAQSAGAERLAPEAFERAAGDERQAENRLKAGETTRGIEQYRQAADSYAGAAIEARKKTELAAREVAAQETAARRAQEQAVAARRTAGDAGAQRQATAKWTEASGVEQTATRALEQKDWEGARSGFRRAATAYGEATALARQSAEDDRLRKEKEEEARREEARRAAATQSREALAPARQAAEEAGAERYAGKLLVAARGKEKDGEAALQRREYEQAGKLFQGAEADYQAAAREAARQRAAIARDVEQLSRKVAGDRDEATQVEAPLLARAPFNRGQARQAQGDTLLAREDLAGARQAYTDAGRAYEESTAQARTRREERARADAARGDMAKEKARARPDSPGYAPAAAHEQQGNNQYQKLAFADARESFRAAGEQYAKAVAPAPAPPAPPVTPPAQSGSQEIRSVLETYARALRTKDLKLLRRVAPLLSEGELKKIQSAFDEAARIEVDFTIEGIQMVDSGSRARAWGKRLDVTVSRDNKASRSEGRFEFLLFQDKALGWYIYRMSWGS